MNDIDVTATDDRLLTAAAGGDRDALGELVRRYVDFVYAAAVRQTADRHDAEDVTQAVFVVLARKAGGVRGRSLAAWLHQTTRYAAANVRVTNARRRKHERAAAKPEHVMTDPTPRPDPLLPLLDAAIADLGDKDRRAVIERYLRGRDVAAVATMLGTTPRAAQKRIERAVERLRGRLAERVRRATNATGRDGRRESHIASVVLPTAALAGVLSAVAPSTVTATPVALTATIAATAQAGLAGTSTAGTSAASLADHIKRALFWSKAKTVAAVAAAVVVGGAGVEAARQIVTAWPTTAAVVPVPATLPGRAADGPVVEAKLKNGATIRFLGVARHPLDDRTTWYGTDGRTLAAVPFATASSFLEDGNGRVARAYAFGIESGVAFDDLGSKPDGAPTVRATPYQPLRTNDGDGLPVRDRIAAVEAVEPGKTASVTLEVAAGNWVPRVVSDANADVSIVSQGDVRRVAIGRPFEDQGRASTFYWPADFYSRPDVRLVAVDTSGGVHIAEQWGGAIGEYRSPEQRSAEPVLDAPVPRLRFDGTRLADVFDRFRDATGLQLSVDWDAMRAIGITEDTTVTGGCGPGPLRREMMLLFQWLDGFGNRLEADVRGGVVYVGPIDWRKPRPIGYYAPDVPLARLARFEVQTRAFDQVVTFDGLPSDLGKKADVRANVIDVVAPVKMPLVSPRATGPLRTLADGSTVELIALGDVSTGDCWLPDGTPAKWPMGFEPGRQSAALAGEGKRAIWVMTVTRRRDGTFVDGLADAAGPLTGAAAGARFMTQGSGDHTYQVFAIAADAGRLAWDVRVGVPSRRTPWRMTLERGPGGWDAAAVTRVPLDGLGAAVLWRPAAEGFTGPVPAGDPTPGTSFRLWTPEPGDAWKVSAHYVLADGSTPDSSIVTSPGPDGVRRTWCKAPLDVVRRVTVEVTQFDQTATFRDLPLQARGAPARGH